MNSPHDSLLGRAATYPDRYAPDVLFAIARAPQRAALGIGEPLPFHGVDIWNAYELSWLDAHGKPNVAIAEIRVPASSANIVESKSLKLYLAGFHQERIGGDETLRARIAHDLSALTGATVDVALILPAQFDSISIGELAGESIDTLPIAIEPQDAPDAQTLTTVYDASEVEETLRSNLLKSNCPVTGQPDWASIEIRYAGRRIDREGLLRYLVSFRQHADFHEHCVERIYVDLWRRCAPRRLIVQARYTRRGGIDINPWRSSEAGDPPNTRSARQ